MTSRPTPPANPVAPETDRVLLDRVLEPYKEHCRYLKAAQCEPGGPEDVLALRAAFEISESCYIADTGHFNSVEFNICYNQMAYYLIARAVQDSLIEPFDAWSMADFWERRLPGILIAEFRSRFRTPMQSAAFSGFLTFRKVMQRGGDRPLLVIHTACGFSDDAGGSSEGAVKIVVTNAPVCH